MYTVDQDHFVPHSQSNSVKSLINSQPNVRFCSSYFITMSLFVLVPSLMINEDRFLLASLLWLGHQFVFGLLAMIDSIAVRDKDAHTVRSCLQERTWHLLEVLFSR